MPVPERFYRNRIDLNRYENDLAERLIVTYNNILVKGVKKLSSLDPNLLNKASAVRLKSIIKQVKKDLERWSKTSLSTMIVELNEIAGIQKDFIEDILEDAIPPEFTGQVNSLIIDDDYVDSLIRFDPTKNNQVLIPKGKTIKDLDVFVDSPSLKSLQNKFALTADVGKEMVLPNGETVTKAFRGITEKSAERLGLTVRQGLLEGKTLQQIQRELVGGKINKMRFKGGALTELTNAQIKTITRTTVQQVVSEISRKSYQINPELVKRWRYSAVHDGKTSAICRALDGKVYKVGAGPYPPQHFNCRSVDVPMLAGIKDKNFVDDSEAYGTWFDKKIRSLNKDQAGKGDSFAEKVLGKSGFKMFKTLKRQGNNANDAMAKFIKRDGSKRSINDMKRIYKKKKTT